MTYKCPYCGSCENPKIEVSALRQLKYGPISGRIVNILVDWFEKHRAIPIDRLIDLVWQHDPNGGPLNARNCIHRHFNEIRPRLEADVGWTISFSGQGGRCSMYKLKPV